MGQAQESVKLVNRLTTVAALVKIDYDENVANEQEGRVTIHDTLGARSATYRCSKRQLNWCANEFNHLLLELAPATFTRVINWADQHLPRVA